MIKPFKSRMLALATARALSYDKILFVWRRNEVYYVVEHWDYQHNDAFIASYSYNKRCQYATT